MSAQEVRGVCGDHESRAHGPSPAHERRVLQLEVAAEEHGRHLLEALCQPRRLMRHPTYVGSPQTNFTVTHSKSTLLGKCPRALTVESGLGASVPEEFGPGRTVLPIALQQRLCPPHQGPHVV
jgi:hypothetical protein